jgi:beta-alanine--pyruvate transaminase
MEKGFHEEGILLRIAGETLVVTPPLIISEDQIGEEKAGKMIAAVV